MSKIIDCICDGDLPEEFKQAAKDELLQVNSVIGWIDLEPDYFDGGRNGCKYKIKEA